MRLIEAIFYGSFFVGSHIIFSIIQKYQQRYFFSTHLPYCYPFNNYKNFLELYIPYKIKLRAQKRVVYKITKTYIKAVEEFEKEMKKAAKKKEITITKNEDFAKELLGYLEKIRNYCMK